MPPPFLSLFRSFSTHHLPLQSRLFKCNKTIQELCKLGRIEEAHKLFDEMPQRDSVTWNSMISGYFENDRIIDAQVLFDAFSGKNVRTWTSMLSGFAKRGQIEEARRVFESMKERNVVSWNAMVSAYVQNGDLRCARKIFDEMPERNVASWNCMITGYCHGCLIREARELFDRMPVRNSVSWMVMISGYAQICCFKEAWGLFVEMHRSGGRPDQPMFVVVLSALTGLNDLVSIECLRSFVIKTGYEKDVVVGTAILNAYTRNGSLDVAMEFFDAMPVKNEYSWTTMIAAFSQSGRLDDAIALYERIPEQTISSMTAMMTAYAQNGRIREAEHIFSEISNPNVVTWNAMLAGYAQNGMIQEAKDIFTRMPTRNSASCAAMIAALVQNGHSEEALRLLAELHRSGNFPSHSCFTSSLYACASLGAIEIGKQIHALTIKMRCQNNSFIGNGLIAMYAKCKNMEDVSQVFGTMGVKDTVSWNTLITGLSDNCMLDDARDTFNKMPEHDVVSWTAIISAYAQAEHGDIALQLFFDMLARGLQPNELTITSVLSACGSVGATKLGEQIHDLVLKLGFNSCLFVNNALITMYFRSGSEYGFSIFEHMPERDIITWNAVLAGCAQNGLGEVAINIFRRMEAEEVFPNEISFLGILCACSRSGLLDEGWAYFNSMSKDYGIEPLVYHYTCVVDLLGRAGRLSEAEALIESMPVEADTVIWEALLSGCRIHRNVELSEKVAKRLFQMGACRPGTYVLLSNIYASQGRWDKVREIREVMKVNRVSKEPGISWIQIKNHVYIFHTADTEHNRIKEVHSLLKEYHRRFKMTGYVPGTECVLHDVEEEQKQDDLLYHSEKLAVAFGMLSTPSGTPIQVMKNLRICGDCHTFMKFLSSVTGRKIVIRDRIRFHHFRDGACTCGDYW